MPSKTEDVATGPAADAATGSAGASADRSVGDAINIATRSVHTKLNKLIIMRLRLALPPQADDASNYVQGLLHIAPIYDAFESLWQDILDAAPVDKPREPADDKSEDSSDSDASQGPTACSRIHLLLFHLRLEKMARADALRQDLAALTGWSDAVLTEQLGEIVSESPGLAAFVRHIKKSVAERPHVLLAYAWVLYMALFSGGRFIRASLERVDPASSFWTPLAGAGSSEASEPAQQQGGPNMAVKVLGPWLASQVGLGGAGGKAADAKQQNDQAAGRPQQHQQQLRRRQQQQQNQDPTQHPLAFFRFDTPTDGEDLKQTFKARLAESTAEGSAGNLLSTKEREDVVAEAQLVFDAMIRAVGELDEVCGTAEEEGGAAAARALSLRSRDSVVVEKEKRRRLAALIAATPAGREAAARGGGKTTGGAGGATEAEKETKGESGSSKGAVRFS
ncbi:hypothetical protein F4820DRAFT_35991 [Hypoxylon rubiginosum]|uniref:Uncharacterized protein n=1 Tax=Hypoxylon rubiginosum TaxID=110542 RepID=A0ACB9YSZ0_9PEZI|nr:hypothetical protein F4820DRAFT_35991 [Hypoxylon rubiginosum]